MIKSKMLNPRLAEIGKIKIGTKGEERTSKSGTKYRLPVKYDHFVITTTERDKKTGRFIIDTEIMKKLDPPGMKNGKKYEGMKPKEIPIILVFDDIDLNFFTSFACYLSKILFCRGDGEKANRRENDIDKQIICNPETCQFFKDKKCKVSGILSSMISLNPEFGGVYRFRTHSWNSVSNILASLQFIAQNTNGVLQGLPLKLKMLKKTTEEHGDVNIVTIVLDGIQMKEMRKLAVDEYRDRKLLDFNMNKIEKEARESGFLKDTDTPEDIEEEFYVPDTIVNVSDNNSKEPDKPAPPEVRIIKENKSEPEKKTVNSEELKDAIENKEEEKQADEQEPENKNQSELDIF